ncbi:uncharacterized protein EV420DRAFT_1485156 [Desarmillaria tabescens]|uniref:Uncharacterized protein n=1 Tax=Armillaria tabescens TaxID=1929756 RepID=A0AA39MR77_ARMTA|nr:uncharacterized protein EV420DRAFT_1485156 [Desarmillaria tabescens]KAK0443044.1 hypothetical protein EV420DRAFT_1485156 [Desarmillaria tabescens]
MASLSKLLDSSTRFDLSTSVWIRNVTLESGVRGLSGLIVWFWSSRRIDIPSPFAEVVSLSSAEDKEQLMPSSASVTTTSRLTTASPTSTLIERGYETTFDFVKGVYVDNGGRHSRRVVRAGSVPRDVKRPKGWWEGIHYRFVITYKHSPVHSTTALVQTGIRDSHYTITFIDSCGTHTYYGAYTHGRLEKRARIMKDIVPKDHRVHTHCFTDTAASGRSFLERPLLQARPSATQQTSSLPNNAGHRLQVDPAGDQRVVHGSGRRVWRVRAQTVGASVFAGCSKGRCQDGVWGVISWKFCFPLRKDLFTRPVHEIPALKRDSYTSPLPVLLLSEPAECFRKNTARCKPPVDRTDQVIISIATDRRRNPISPRLVG